MVQKSTIHIPLSELTKISFVCDHCRATITVDISEREQRQLIVTANKQCPVCAYRIKNSIFTAFSHYLTWFDQATNADQGVQFVIDRD